jgi:TolB protein
LVAAWTLGGAASASYPGTNGKIGFVRFDDGFDIYSVNPNGSDLDRLTGARSDYEPTWSPDGSMVAFDRIVGGRYQVFTMDADGSNRTQITAGEADNLWSTWSPDGLTIAFTRYRDQDGDDEIYSMNLDGTGLTRLTRNRVTDLHAAWSPDGEKIAFNRERRGRTNLWVMDADGSDPINLTPGPTDGGAASWSPDGSEIAFVTDGEIYVMDADGSDIRRLTTNSWRENSPAWSPDGTRIAFHSSRFQPGDIWTMDADDGSDPVRVTKTKRINEFDPDWQPIA